MGDLNAIDGILAGYKLAGGDPLAALSREDIGEAIERLRLATEERSPHEPWVASVNRVSYALTEYLRERQ